MASVVGTPTVIANGGTYTAGAGSNRVIPFAVSFVDNDAANSVTALTFGGVAAHIVEDVEGPTAATNRPYVSWWYLNEADGIPSGAQVATATFALSPVTQRIHCFTVQDAHQTDFTVTDIQSNSSATSLTGGLTSTNDSVVLAAMTADHNAGNTGVTWTGLTEATDSTSGAPSQRFSAAYKNAATGAAESFSPAVSVAVAMAMVAMLVKNIAGGSSTPRNLALLGVGR